MVLLIKLLVGTKIIIRRLSLRTAISIGLLCEIVENLLPFFWSQGREKPVSTAVKTAVPLCPTTPKEARQEPSSTHTHTARLPENFPGGD